MLAVLFSAYNRKSTLANQRISDKENHIFTIFAMEYYCLLSKFFEVESHLSRSIFYN